MQQQIRLKTGIAIDLERLFKQFEQHKWWVLLTMVIATLISIGLNKTANLLNPTIIYFMAIVFIFSGYALGRSNGLLAGAKYNDIRCRELELQNEELQLENDQLQLISNTDSLTGIANRRYLEGALLREWHRSQRDGLPISVALIDIDYFKDFNDTYGHQAGDDCLKQVVAAIDGSLYRFSDFVARYGGEEFVILLSNTNIDGAVKVGQKMRKIVENLNVSHDSSPISRYVTVSIGVVTIVPVEGMDHLQLIHKADVALYQAKRSGRNTVSICVDNTINHKTV